ncbi:MAG TPA: tetratricopeptide repeat protein [Bryobacteraceae bacterium]
MKAQGLKRQSGRRDRSGKKEGTGVGVTDALARTGSTSAGGILKLDDVGKWALLFFATLAVYWPALQGDRIWDDSQHITRPELQSLHGLWRIWFDLGATQQYYPLLHSAFWIEHQLWGDSLLGYHLLNVALHAISAGLVVLIVRRLALPGAWLGGFVFALHPVCVEAVAWISEQKSTLSAVFCLSAALAYLHFDQTRRRSFYLAATGLFVAALLTKSVTATLPAALLVILWWQRGRLDWKRDGMPLLPWFALAVPMGLFTAWVERTFIGARGAVFDLTLTQRILLAARVVWFYAGKLIWPVNLTFSYPHWKIDPAAWWQYLYSAALLAVAVVLWRIAPRNRGPLAAFLIFGGTLFPVLGFLNVLPFRYAWVADHFQYLASLALIVPAAALVTAGSARVLQGRPSGAAIPVALAAVLGVLTWQQSGMYRDDETLYRETLARNPDSFLAHNNLGSILVRKPDRLPDAIAEFEAARRIEPGYPEGHFNLGSALAHLSPDQLPNAIEEYEEALRIKPDYAEAYSNLGNALSHVPGRLNDAIADFQAALRIKPELAEAHMNLGRALAQTPGRLPDAIAEFQAAVRIKPDLAELHYNLGTALSQMPDRSQDAAAEFRTAVRLRPDFAEAHFNLGTLLSQIPGGLPEAISEFEATLAIRPDFEPAQQALRQLGAAGR